MKIKINCKQCNKEVMSIHLHRHIIKMYFVVIIVKLNIIKKIGLKTTLLNISPATSF